MRSRRTGRLHLVRNWGQLMRGGGTGSSPRRRYRRFVLLPCGLLIALIVLDSLVGAFFYRTGTEARVQVVPARQGAAQRAIVILPGYAMTGRYVGQAFAPYVGDGDALVSVDYAQRGVDTREIYRKTMDALRGLKPARLVIYGASMGGMVGADFLRHYQDDGAQFGKVSLILDTAPSTLADIKRPAWLAKATCWYRGGPLSTAVWAAAVGLMADPPAADGESQLIDKAHHAGRWVGTAALATQACFISRFALAADQVALQQVVSRASYLHGSPATDDPLVNTQSSADGWRTVFPALADVPISGRDGRWHIPLVEQPKETVAAILSVID